MGVYVYVCTQGFGAPTAQEPELSIQRVCSYKLNT